MKFFSILLSLLFLFSLLVSCDVPPNAEALLQYENTDFTADVQFSDMPFSLHMARKNGCDAFSVTDGILSGVTFTVDKEGNTVCQSDGFSVDFPESRISVLSSLFRLSGQNLLWKIEETSVGGISVYRLQSDAVAVYLAKDGFSPLRIESPDMTATIANYQKSRP